MVVIKRNLANGSPVRLGDLGSFRPSVSGKGTEDASKCGASSVKKARVIYVPSAEIKEAVSMYSFSKAGASAANEDGEGGDEKPNQGKSPMNEKSFHRAFHLRVFGERNMLLKVS